MEGSTPAGISRHASALRFFFLKTPRRYFHFPSKDGTRQKENLDGT